MINIKECTYLMIALKILKIRVMVDSLILPYSYNREHAGIFNDSTEDTKDAGHDVLINSIQIRRSC